MPEPEAARSLSRLNLSRWVVVHANFQDPGQRRWEQLADAGAELRLGGDDFRIYELPFKKGQPPAFSDRSETGGSIFGTPIRPLSRDDLRARIIPLRKRVIDRFALGTPIPWRLQNLSSVRWPAVAVSQKGLVGLVFRARRPGESAYEPLRDFHRLPADLAPRQKLTVWATVISPRQPGVYEVFPCLTQGDSELTRCFENASTMLRVGDVAAWPATAGQRTEDP
jgi:hypothetical protein